MTRYLWTDRGFVDGEGRPLVDPNASYAPVTPMIIRDIPDYRSPIDGRLISGRTQRREDLIRNDCVEWDPSMSPTGRKFKNKRFAAKHGVEVSEEFR